MVDLAKADIRAIAAVGKNGAIGLNGKLPWNKEKGDLSFFKQQTIGGIVVFGYNTVKENIMLNELPERRVCVWQKRKMYHKTTNLQAAFADIPTWDYPNPNKFLEDILDDYKTWPKSPTIWIAGGVETYRTFAPWTKSLCLTPVNYNGKFDVLFPFDAFFNVGSLLNNTGTIVNLDKPFGY